LTDERALSLRGEELSKQLRSLVEHSRLLREQSAELCALARAMRRDVVALRDTPRAPPYLNW
jgi:hypothetical protein